MAKIQNTYMADLQVAHLAQLVKEQRLMAGNLSCDGSLSEPDSVAADMLASLLALALLSGISIYQGLHRPSSRWTLVSALLA